MRPDELGVILHLHLGMGNGEWEEVSCLPHALCPKGWGGGH